MLEQFLNALPMALIIIGAFWMLLLSRSTHFTLDKLNFIAVSFVLLSVLLQFVLFNNESSKFLFEDLFGNTFILDKFSKIFDLMFSIGTILTLLINRDYFKSRTYFNGEYFALLLFSVFGMMILAHAYELVSLFIALEIASLSIYTLVGYHKTKNISSEAMLKYMILGSLTGAFFVLGIALVYGAVGSTNLVEIRDFIATKDSNELRLLILGMSFMGVSILFKMGAVPLHSWLLDVYHGAPYPITMFMASTFKIAVFAVAIRLLITLVDISNIWMEVLQMITIMTLLGGSWLAISQNYVKRMLAGSSIVHTGYLLIGISSIGLGSELAASSVMFYLIAYFLSAVGAFGILSFIASRSSKQMKFDDFKGFAQHRPYLALAMSIFMLSLAGFPSTIGFLGKFYIFTSAIESKQIFLAALGILTAFISVYYYFKLIAMMYFYESEEIEQKLPLDSSTVLIFVMAFSVVWGGIGTSLIPFVPGADGLIDIARDAIKSVG